MPAVDAETPATNADNGNDESPSLSGPIIGIIYPPPEVRSILNLKIANCLQTFLCFYFSFVSLHLL